MNKIYEIDRIFADCLDDVLAGRATVNECLASHPEHAAELGGLLSTSLKISVASKAIVPPTGAKMRIRVALTERMAELSETKKLSKPFWRFGWANAIATFILSLSLMGGGVAYAASESMPGQVLYPLKINLEQALVSFTFSKDARIELYAALNDRRVEEIVYLARMGDSLGMAGVTSRLEGNLSAAAALKGLSGAEFARALNAPADTSKDSESTIASMPPSAPAQGTGQGPVTTISFVEDGSALDSVLSDYAISQLNALAGASSSANSPAVQAALEKAMAAVKNGYDALISQPN